MSFRLKSVDGSYDWWEFRSTAYDGLTVDTPYMVLGVCPVSYTHLPAIREETERRRQEYDTVIGENGYSLSYRNRPYDQEKNAAGMAANIEPDVDQARRQRLIIFIILDVYKRQIERCLPRNVVIWRKRY